MEGLGYLTENRRSDWSTRCLVLQSAVRSFRLAVVEVKPRNPQDPPKGPLIEPLWSLIAGISGIIEGS